MNLTSSTSPASIWSAAEVARQGFNPELLVELPQGGVERAFSGLNVPRELHAVR
jgi:hypothetical protein